MTTNYIHNRQDLRHRLTHRREHGGRCGVHIRFLRTRESTSENDIDILVVIGKGDIDSTHRNLIRVLALEDIDSNVTVVNEPMFRKNARLSYTKPTMPSNRDMRYEGIQNRILPLCES